MTNWRFLTAILILAFLVRLGAVNFGLPQSLFGDELVSVAGAFRLLDDYSVWGNKFLYIPPLFSYILAPIFGVLGALGVILGKFSGIAGFREFVILNKEYFLIVSRIVSALFGTWTIYLLYLLSKKVFSDWRPAVLSAVLLAADFLHIHESQVGRFWVPATFFIVAGMYCILKMRETKEFRWYLWSALAIGFGFGMSYITIILVPWFLAAHFLSADSVRGIWVKLKEKKMMIGGAILLALIVVLSVANLYGFFRQFGRLAPNFLDFFGIDAPRFTPKTIDPNPFQSVQDLFIFLWSESPLFLIAGVIGLFVWARKASPNRFLLSLIAGMPVLYGVGMIFGFEKIEHRFVLPILPALLLGTSYLLFILLGKYKGSAWRIIIVGVYVAGVYWYSIYPYYLYQRILWKKDTRIQAMEWIEKNIPAGSVVILDVRNTYLNENKASIEIIKEKSPFWLNVKERYLLTLSESQYPQPAYLVLDRNHLLAEAIDFSEISSGYYAFDFWNQEERSKLPLPENATLIVSFYPRTDILPIHNILQDPRFPRKTLSLIERIGPYVEIYKF